MIQTGPDGALWVADMYRDVIEHPAMDPEGLAGKLDLRAGHDQGRIYRVYPVGTKPRPIPRLDKMASAELAAAMDSPNGPQRDLVQQLLLWRRDKQADKQTAKPFVEKLTQPATSCPRATTRMQALCTLDGLDLR